MSSSTFLSQAKDDFVYAIFDENATKSDLYKLAAILAVFIFVLFSLLEPFLRWLFTGPLNKTMWKIVEVEFDRADIVKERERQGITTKQDYYDKVAIEQNIFLVLLGMQHFLGGLCAVPAVLGVGNFSNSVSSSLACFGILIEMGWEIQDLCWMILYRIFMGKEGEKKYPNLAIMIAFIHHSLACTMGVPMIHAYRNLPELHRLNFDLQFAAGCSLAVFILTRTLDVKKKNDLRLFVFVALFNFLLNTWTRGIDWVYISYKLLTVLYTDKNWTFLIVGSIIISIFTLFNIPGHIAMYKRSVKFAKKLREFGSLPADADDAIISSVTSELQTSIRELVEVETRPEQVMVNLFESRQPIKRRHSANMGAISRAAALATISEQVSTRRILPRGESMVAWRNMPSRVKARAENKTD